MSCSTLMTAGAAGGGAAIGSLAGPGGAAIGGVAGVVAIELLEGEEEVPIPLEGPASTVYQIDNLINDIGWWFLAIFVLVPFLSKRFRLGTASLLSPTSKKQVESQEERLNKLEEFISSLNNKNKK